MEMADVLMYYNDVMLCYGITAGELKGVYGEIREEYEAVVEGMNTVVEHKIIQCVVKPLRSYEDIKRVIKFTQVIEDGQEILSL